MTDPAPSIPPALLFPKRASHVAHSEETERTSPYAASERTDFGHDLAFQLAKAIGSLHETVRRLENRIDILEGQHEPADSAPSLTPRALPPPEELEREILDYFTAHPDTYPSDAAFALNLDPREVFLFCAQLVAEGKLGA